MVENPQIAPVNDPQQLWQSQGVEGIKMSAEVIRRRAGKFERRIHWRNRREYLASLIAVVMFGYFFAKDHDVLARLGYVLFIAGVVWVVIQLHRKAAPRRMSDAIAASTSLQFFRTELERQRDMVRNVWPWYLAPMVPGFIAQTISVLVARPFPASLVRVALMDGMVAALFFGVWKLNQRAARCLQRTIDELPEAENSQ